MNHAAGLIPIALAAVAFVAARTAPDRMIDFNRHIHGHPLTTERLMWWWFRGSLCLVGVAALIMGTWALITGG